MKTDETPDAASPTCTRESAGNGVHRVDIVAVSCGPDLCVVIQGGTHHHVGAVALALPRPSLDDPSRTSASASVLCVLGHKEDQLARDAALRLASALNRPVSVTAGLHLDNAAPADIDRLVTNCRHALDSLTMRLVRERSASETSNAPGQAFS